MCQACVADSGVTKRDQIPAFGDLTISGKKPTFNNRTQYKTTTVINVEMEQGARRMFSGGLTRVAGEEVQSLKTSGRSVNWDLRMVGNAGPDRAGKVLLAEGIAWAQAEQWGSRRGSGRLAVRSLPGEALKG